MVPMGKTQYDVLREAVQNHAPQCIIVDEVAWMETSKGVYYILTRRGIKNGVGAKRGRKID